MRFMVIVKATKDSEAGKLPDEKLLADMGKFNEELAKAGVLLAGEGLQASSKGARVKLQWREAHRDRRAVHRDQGAHRRILAVEGEVAGGGDRLGQALPQSFSEHRESEIEIRQVFEAEDFGEAFTPELRQAEERMRAQTSTRN